LPYSFDFLPGFQFYDRGIYSYDTRTYYQDKNHLDLYNPQIQQMLILGKHTFLVGADYFRGKGEYSYSDLLHILYRNFTYTNETLIYAPWGELLYDGPFWDPYVEPLSARSLIRSVQFVLLSEMVLQLLSAGLLESDPQIAGGVGGNV
jgi:hypothetical protein